MGHEASAVVLLIKNYAQTVCGTRPGTTLASWELFSNLPEFFLLDVSVRALFRVCFFETGVLWACLALFDLRVFPCG